MLHIDCSPAIAVVFKSPRTVLIVLCPSPLSQDYLPCFSGQLQQYQLEGVTRLISFYNNGVKGILADQFGLGKTTQVVALLSHLWAHQIRGPFLIVCPTSRLSHWVSKLQKLCPELPVLMYHGNDQEREQLWHKYIEGGNPGLLFD